MNKYSLLSDDQLNLLAARFDVTADNMDAIVSEIDVFMDVDFDNDWQRVIVIDNQAFHRFSFEQKDQADDCFQQYLTEQQCVALELECRVRRYAASESLKAY